MAFTGSSLLEILNSRADLSRRALIYDMQGLSFREFIQLETGLNFSAIPLKEILRNHIDISNDILAKIKPFKYFSNYLSFGYYPFFKEFSDMFLHQLEAVINMIIEVELPLLRGVDMVYSKKLKQLLRIIAESAPFIPNVSALSQKIGINRQTMLSYLHYLEEAGLTKNLYRNNRGISLLQKPEKIFLENTNLSFAVASEKPGIGNLRETFFLNQLSYKHQVTFPETGDFRVDNNYLFEIGGKNKNSKQISGVKNTFVVVDDIEFGYKNTIPLWLFGFLY